MRHLVLTRFSALILAALACGVLLTAAIWLMRWEMSVLPFLLSNSLKLSLISVVFVGLTVPRMSKAIMRYRQLQAEEDAEAAKPVLPLGRINNKT